MRRANHLFEQVVGWDNLRVAVHKALRGKWSRADARVFVSQLDDNLERMRSGLLAGDVPLGVYRQFTIFDPKERLITAPCFAERVLHHAILNVWFGWAFRRGVLESLPVSGHRPRTG
jgi:hypothetical protein